MEATSMVVVQMDKPLDISSVVTWFISDNISRFCTNYDDEQTVCEARIAELKKELDNAETTKVDLKRFIKLIRKYKDCDTLTDEMLYELVEKVVIHSASGGRTIYRQQQIDIYFNFIGDTFPSQIEISRGDKKNLTEQQLAKRKKYQKTAGENRKKKRAALREAATGCWKHGLPCAAMAVALRIP